MIYSVYTKEGVLVAKVSAISKAEAIAEVQNRHEIDRDQLTTIAYDDKTGAEVPSYIYS